MVAGTGRRGDTLPGRTVGSVTTTALAEALWQRLNLRPLPHQHASFDFGRTEGRVIVVIAGHTHRTPAVRMR